MQEAAACDLATCPSPARAVLAVPQGLVALGLCHDSLSLVLVGHSVAAAADYQVAVAISATVLA